LNSVLKIGDVEAEPGKKASGYIYAGETPGHRVEIPLTIINGTGEGPVVAVTAGLHGTEYVGMATALDLARSIKPEDVSGALLIVPVVNLPGFEWRTRCTCPIEDDYTGTKNLNRLFPGESDYSMPYLIARTLFNEVGCRANFAIDIHGGDVFEYLNPCTMIFTVGKPEIDHILVEMARASGQERCIKVTIEHIKGAFVVELVKKGIPAIVVESGDAGVIDEKSVRKAIDAVTNVLKYVKALKGESNDFSMPRFVKGTNQVRIKRGGLLRTLVPLSSTVSAGDRLGVIQGLDGEVLEEIVAPVNGFVNRWVCNPSASSGESVVSVAEYYE